MSTGTQEALQKHKYKLSPDLALQQEAVNFII